MKPPGPSLLLGVVRLTATAKTRFDFASCPAPKFGIGFRICVLSERQVSDGVLELVVMTPRGLRTYRKRGTGRRAWWQVLRRV